MTEAALPGIVAGVFGDDGLLWEGRAGGTARQYRIGSITKTVTAVAVLQLREQGLLDLDDQLRRYVPDTPYPQASLRDLLEHRSGLTAEPSGSWWERSPGVEWPALAAANTAPAAAWPPRVRYHYSNLGFALLGEVVARRTGQSWYDAVHARILAPLGLHETTYLPSADAAVGTSRNPRSGALVKEPAFDSAAMAPAGQLWSTVADLGTWGSFLVRGNDDVLPVSVLTEMRTASSADPETQHQGAYGLGLRLRWRSSSTLVGHTGSMPGFLAAVFTDAISGVGAVVLANATVGIAPEDLAAALVEQTEPHIRGASLPGTAPRSEHSAEATTDSAVDELAGEWFWGNSLLTIVVRGLGFSLRAPNGWRTFERVERDSYVGLDGYYAGERLHLVRRLDGSLSHLEVVSFIFTRKPYDPSAPIPGGVPEPLVNSPD